MNNFSQTFQLLKDKCNKLPVKIVAGILVVLLSATATVVISDKLESNRVSAKVITVSNLNTDDTYLSMLGDLGVTKINYKSLREEELEDEALDRLEKEDKQVDALAVSAAQAAKDMATDEVLNLVADRTAEKLQAEKDIADRAAQEQAAKDRLANLNNQNANAQVKFYADGYDPISAALNNNSGSGGQSYTLTGYCSCSICCGKYSNPDNPTTASGTRATAGRTIAADTHIYPFGTQISINGHVYTVEDTGSGVNGYHFDIYFDSHEEALQFGKRYTTNVYRVN